MIHKSNKFEFGASPHKNIRIINESSLNLLKTNLSELAKGVTANINNINRIDD